MLIENIELLLEVSHQEAKTLEEVFEKDDYDTQLIMLHHFKMEESISEIAYQKSLALVELLRRMGGKST